MHVVRSGRDLAILHRSFGTWLINLWDTLRASFWFLPTGMVLVAGMLGGLFPLADELIDGEPLAGLAWTRTTPDSARSLLVLLAGSLLSITGVVFSITMLTLSQTSAQFGSRLLRTFLNHNLTQFTLGVFLGTALYCLLVLRTVRGSDELAFTPHLSTAVAVGLAVFSLGVFIAFIHHVATTLQAQTVVTTVADELNETIDRLFPASDEEEPATTAGGVETARSPLHGFVCVQSVESCSRGYVQAIDVGVLKHLAAARGVVIQLLLQPGKFVAVGQLVARILQPAGPAAQPEGSDSNSEFADQVSSAFLTGSRRTPRQDVECGIMELVEVAVRALSPGINDPFTAVTCVDCLGDSLGRLAQRPMPPAEYRSDRGNLCVIAQQQSFAAILDTAFRPIRFHAGGSLLVTVALFEALQRLTRQVRTAVDAEKLREHASAVLAAARAGFSLQVDLETAETLHEEVLLAVEERFPVLDSGGDFPPAAAVADR